RALVGEVGPETVPARRMLERLGFTYDNLVDPFDGGPYITAATKDIQLVKDTFSTTFGNPVLHSKTDQCGIVSKLDSDGEFIAIQAAFVIDSQGRVCVTKESMEAIQATVGSHAGCTPMRVPVVP